MTMRLTTVDEFQFLTGLQHQVWGSKTARFRDWQAGGDLVHLRNRGGQIDRLAGRS